MLGSQWHTVEIQCITYVLNTIDSWGVRWPGKNSEVSMVINLFQCILGRLERRIFHLQYAALTVEFCYHKGVYVGGTRRSTSYMKQRTIFRAMFPQTIRLLSLDVLFFHQSVLLTWIPQDKNS